MIKVPRITFDARMWYEELFLFNRKVLKYHCADKKTPTERWA